MASDRSGVSPGSRADRSGRALLETAYLAYLAALNERRFDDLVHHVCDDVTHNGHRMSGREYADLRRQEARDIPDLRFEVQQLLTSDERVAARLWFDCTPTATFQDLEPTGGRVRFAEHVFYRYVEGRIAEVWSLLDVDAVREQLRPGG